MSESVTSIGAEQFPAAEGGCWVLTTEPIEHQSYRDRPAFVHRLTLVGGWRRRMAKAIIATVLGALLGYLVLAVAFYDMSSDIRAPDGLNVGPGRSNGEFLLCAAWCSPLPALVGFLFRRAIPWRSPELEIEVGSSLRFGGRELGSFEGIETDDRVLVLAARSGGVRLTLSTPEIAARLAARLTRAEEASSDIAKGESA